jgi:hypothetical protein
MSTVQNLVKERNLMASDVDKITKILQKADRDIKRIQKRNNYCAGWEGFFNLQDTRITKSGAFDKIHTIILKNKPEFQETDSVKKLPASKKKSIHVMEAKSQ